MHFRNCIQRIDSVVKLSPARPQKPTYYLSVLYSNLFFRHYKCPKNQQRMRYYQSDPRNPFWHTKTLLNAPSDLYEINMGGYKSNEH